MCLFPKTNRYYLYAAILRLLQFIETIVLITMRNATITVYVSSIYSRNQNEAREQVKQYTSFYFSVPIAFEWLLNFPFSSTDEGDNSNFSLGGCSMTKQFVRFRRHGIVNSPIKGPAISEASYCFIILE